MAVHILSSHTHPRLASPVNHQCYAGRHGYGYLFDVTPYPVASPYDQKLHAILRALDGMPDDDVLVWIDDDAYFMQLDRPLDEWFPAGVLAGRRWTPRSRTSARGGTSPCTGTSASSTATRSASCTRSTGSGSSTG